MECIHPFTAVMPCKCLQFTIEPTNFSFVDKQCFFCSVPREALSVGLDFNTLSMQFLLLVPTIGHRI